MKRRISFWSLVFFPLAVAPLVSNCGMDGAQTNKPVMTASASGHMAANVSPATQPVVGGAVADNAYGATAMAATTDTPQTGGPVAGRQGATAPPFADDATDYRISQQDILQISVFQVNDLNNTVQVGQDGNITLPLVGRVQVAGRTTPEAEQIIAGKLRQKYLQSPQVSVQVKSYGKRITVSGATGSRVLPDDGNTTLSQAIASAGGVAEIGNAERIHVARVKDQHVQDNIYNLDDIQAGKVADPLLHGGDIVVVEQSGVKLALKDLYSLMPLAIFAPLF